VNLAGSEVMVLAFPKTSENGTVIHGSVEVAGLVTEASGEGIEGVV